MVDRSASSSRRWNVTRKSKIENRESPCAYQLAKSISPLVSTADPEWGVSAIKQPVLWKRVASGSGTGCAITAVGLTVETQFRAAKRFRATDAKSPVVERTPGPMGIDRLQDREPLGGRSSSDICEVPLLVRYKGAKVGNWRRTAHDSVHARSGRTVIKPVPGVERRPGVGQWRR
mgnify:CR=1 FL=1